MHGMTKHIRDAFDITDTDKGYYHQYEYMYGFIFANFIPNSIFEIGVKDGASIWTWQILFPSAKVDGMDIKIRPVKTKKDFKYIIADSTTYDTKEFPNYDIIIDDGSHLPEDQIKTFLNFKDKFNYCYIIEDINFTKDNDITSDKPLKQIVDVVQKEGYKGVFSFISYNKRKNTRALVIMHPNF